MQQLQSCLEVVARAVQNHVCEVSALAAGGRDLFWQSIGARATPQYREPHNQTCLIMPPQPDDVLLSVRGIAA